MMQFTQTFLSAYWDLLVMFTFKQDHIDPGLDHSRSILMSYKMLLAKHNDLKRVYKNGFFRRLEWGNHPTKVHSLWKYRWGSSREYKARYRHMVLWKSERIFMPGNTLHL